MMVTMSLITIMLHLHEKKVCLKYGRPLLETDRFVNINLISMCDTFHRDTHRFCRLLALQEFRSKESSGNTSLHFKSLGDTKMILVEGCVGILVTAARTE